MKRVKACNGLRGEVGKKKKFTNFFFGCGGGFETVLGTTVDCFRMKAINHEEDLCELPKHQQNNLQEHVLPVNEFHKIGAIL